MLVMAILSAFFVFDDILVLLIALLKDFDVALELTNLLWQHGVVTSHGLERSLLLRLYSLVCLDVLLQLFYC